MYSDIYLVYRWEFITQKSVETIDMCVIIIVFYMFVSVRETNSQIGVASVSSTPIGVASVSSAPIGVASISSTPIGVASISSAPIEQISLINYNTYFM